MNIETIQMMRSIASFMLTMLLLKHQRPQTAVIVHRRVRWSTHHAREEGESNSEGDKYFYVIVHPGIERHGGLVTCGVVNWYDSRRLRSQNTKLTDCCDRRTKALDHKKNELKTRIDTYSLPYIAPLRLGQNLEYDVHDRGYTQYARTSRHLICMKLRRGSKQRWT